MLPKNGDKSQIEFVQNKNGKLSLRAVYVDGWRLECTEWRSNHDKQPFASPLHQPLNKQIGNCEQIYGFMIL